MFRIIDMTMSAFDVAHKLDDDYVMHTYGRLPVEFVSGNGAELVDSAGKTYLDFLAGIGSVSLGHANPVVAAALKDQVDRVWQVGNYYYVENRGELARGISDLLSTTTDELGHVTGSTGSVWKSFFTNSGAESNEGALKVARRWGESKLGGASGIVTARQSFHGRTLATLAATGQDVFHKSFGPMPEGFVSVPLNDISALEEAVASTNACAVLLECVQGEGGVWPADLNYLRSVRQLCSERNILLMVDEVQTGFFRCGAPFSFQLAGIEADVVSMAKGIASGFPMGAVAARGEYGNLLVPGDHGSTFGGNALAAAAGRATVEEMVASGIGKHVIEVGAHLAERLEALPHVTEVRGRGLMRGAQFDVPIATPLVDKGLEAGLVLNHIGDSILRFLPPLVVTIEQVDAMADRLAALINDLA
ncbi:MAG: aminotransferase class III-fold pyridoxal phosphate-dependent enzyme [Atopobiaceae bacterium]|nr:aminotransferase class III-fold pyridoxal phosphate-dependent enzyme [Atopobiaceae bacterium]MBQ6650126.1 aminotransferase class III-fold pyridoxal phosphate-dependent enzyme [Atopobiaceae bacterium]